MKDITGSIITLLRADPAVAAIVGTKVSASAQAPPSVQLIADAGTVRPFGPGSGRVSLQRAVYFGRCYGAPTGSDSTGAIGAQQLAGSVIDALHNLYNEQVGTAYLKAVYAPTWEGVQEDQDTRWPYVDVTIEAIGGAQPV